MKPILIVDYGMGNLRSVQKAFEKMGHAAEISGDPNKIAECDQLVLPGVGAFRDAIGKINGAGMAAPIRDHVRAGKPFLGICLGLHLIFTRGYEDGVHEGLDLIPGDVVRFKPEPGLKIPHMGWNHLRVVKPAPIFADMPPNPAVYFVHSYYAVPKDPTMIATETDYQGPFASAVWHENIFATQFHPEKSQRVGLSILHKFATLR